MGVNAGGQKGGSVADINVVPLIDILLVLLIIFMVITPLTPKGLQALLPQPRRSDIPEGPKPIEIVVQVGVGGSLKINQEEITWDAIEGRLAEIFKERAEKVAFIRGDAPVEFAEVARAISIMRSSGIEQVGLLTAGMETGR